MGIAGPHAGHETKRGKNGEILARSLSRLPISRRQIEPPTQFEAIANRRPQRHLPGRQSTRTGADRIARGSYNVHRNLQVGDDGARRPVGATNDKTIQAEDFRELVVTTYKTSDFRKGLKVEIDGEPYAMIEMNFVKPGKGNAFYKCKLRNLLRNTVLDRTYKGGDTLESADVEEIATQFLYRQGDTFVFMDNNTYEQYEVTAEQIDDTWKYLKESTVCDMLIYNGNPVAVTPPNHIELVVTECEPGAKGDTATNVTKPAKVETGAEFQVPIFIKPGNVIKIDTRTVSTWNVSVTDGQSCR
jgi:elongation factor P